MPDDFKKEASVLFEKVVNFLKEDLKKVYVGRASIDIVGDILVDTYGSKTPIKNVAALSLQGPKDILIEPWDKSNLRKIEAGILKSALHLSTKIESDSTVRVIFPSLTDESRKDMLKLIHQKREQTRITLRHEREKIAKKIESQFKDKLISEDRRFQLKKEIQKSSDEFSSKIDELIKNKEEVINS